MATAPVSPVSEESEEELEEYVDAFPDRIFAADELIELNEALRSALTMKTLYSRKADAVPVIPCKLESDEDDDRSTYKIAFFNLIQDRHMLTAQFERLYQEACTLLPRTGLEDVDWSHVDNRMMKLPKVGHRFRNWSKVNKTDGKHRKKNADIRQSFIYRHQHLVKKHLTNGVRNTMTAIHLYLVYSVPILIYRMKDGCSINVRSSADGTFYPSTKNSFEPFLLTPVVGRKCTVFAVPMGNKYLTLSLQKTCYAIFRVAPTAFMEIQENHDIYDAFDPINAFRPKTAEEIQRLLATHEPTPKRKRGRPPKSLDSIYWYKRTEPRQPPNSQPQKQEAQPQPKNHHDPQPVLLTKALTPVSKIPTFCNTLVPTKQVTPSYLDEPEMILSVSPERTFFENEEAELKTLSSELPLLTKDDINSHLPQNFESVSESGENVTRWLNVNL